MFSFKLSGSSVALVALIAFLIHIVNGENCDDSKKEIGVFAKKLLKEIETQVCAKCQVHMDDLKFHPDALKMVEDEVMVNYAGKVKGDMPLNKDKYRSIVAKVMDKCINKYKGKELCKEMKPKEGEIKSCIIQNVMFDIDIGALSAHLEKYCLVMRAFFKSEFPRYKKIIDDWPAKHPKACKK